ncbi:uncharacterized protein [Rutidosis leptorrhynchoides]|uniref:uncharacterized protein n=1 Tax=Rutidosis leptorrhynchoides TaxID=125765 RepID=UPI003A9A0AE2
MDLESLYFYADTNVTVSNLEATLKSGVGYYDLRVGQRLLENVILHIFRYNKFEVFVFSFNDQIQDAINGGFFTGLSLQPKSNDLDTGADTAAHMLALPKGHIKSLQVQIFWLVRLLT